MWTYLDSGGLGTKLLARRLETDFGSSKGFVGSGREVLVALIGRGVVTS